MKIQLRAILDLLGLRKMRPAAYLCLFKAICEARGETVFFRNLRVDLVGGEVVSIIKIV